MWVAFSGGLDSAVLLHLCHALRTEHGSPDLAAAHVHHGLHVEADRWAGFCQASCDALDIPLTIRHVDARHAAGESPEAAAREARYTALRSLIRGGDALLTGHHQDDQAETVLLQLFRGAGPAGLAAMPEWAAFGPGYLGRPLCGWRREVLADYARRHRLRWIDDTSNTDSRFARNFLRTRILPRLEERWPGLAGSLARSARHCAEADALLGELASEWLDSVREPSSNALSVDALAAYALPRQRLILREWLRVSGCGRPPEKVIARVLDEVLGARPDRQPGVRWGRAQIRRFRGELHLLRPVTEFRPTAVIPWSGAAPLALAPDNGTLYAMARPGPGLDPAAWHRQSITVRYRRGGERLHIAGRDGTRELKKLLQEARIAPWLRDRVPLVYLDDRLAAVADLWVTAPFAGNPAAENFRLVWERPRLSPGNGAVQEPRGDPERPRRP